MEETEQRNLFNITITDSSKQFIRRFAGITRIAIVLSIITSLIFLTKTVIYAIKISRAAFGQDKLALFEHSILPYYSVGYIVLISLQVYYYWQVTRQMDKGIEQDDTIIFNQSFELLYRYSVYGLITTSFTFLLQFLDLLVAVNRQTN